MTTTEMNNKLKNGAVVTICPWTNAFSNQFTAQVKDVAGNRTVTYTWESGDGEEVQKTSQVSYSTWNYIVESLRGE